MLIMIMMVMVMIILMMMHDYEDVDDNDSNGDDATDYMTKVASINDVDKRCFWSKIMTVVVLMSLPTTKSSWRLSTSMARGPGQVIWVDRVER